MKIEIKSWTSKEEADVVEAFLVWQCQPISVRVDKFPGVLEYTKGRPACCIILYKDEHVIERVLVGFKELLEYWNKQGLWLI